MKARIPSSVTDYFQKENICFFMSNFFLFATNALYFGFMMAFLTSKGYSAFEAGLINSVSCVVSLFFQPLAGFITDTFLPMKKYVVLGGIGGVACIFLLPMLSGSIWGAVFAVLLYCVFFTPLSFLIDTWVVTLRDERPYIDYGKNRIGGSAGYAIMAAAAGGLVSFFHSYTVLFICGMITISCMVLSVLPLPTIPCRNAGGTRKERQEEAASLRFGQALGILLKNKTYLLFLLSSCGYNIAMKPCAVDMSYKIQEINGTDSQLGIALAVAAIFECPVLFVITRFVRRFRLSALYVTSITFMAIRGALLAFAPNFEVLLISQIFQALSYGSYLAVSLEIVSRITPVNVRATGITFMVGITSGVGGIIGTMGSGVLIDLWGVSRMAVVLTLIAAASALLYSIPMILDYRKDPNLVV